MKSYSLILGLILGMLVIGVLVIGFGGSQDPASIRYNPSTETTDRATAFEAAVISSRQVQAQGQVLFHAAQPLGFAARDEWISFILTTWPRLTIRRISGRKLLKAK
jgi:hypothetical protein